MYDFYDPVLHLMVSPHPKPGPVGGTCDSSWHISSPGKRRPVGAGGQPYMGRWMKTKGSWSWGLPSCPFPSKANGFIRNWQHPAGQGGALHSWPARSAPSPGQALASVGCFCTPAFSRCSYSLRDTTLDHPRRGPSKGRTILPSFPCSLGQAALGLNLG